MFLELKDDFVHLESSSDGLDQDSAADSTTRHANHVLRQLEDIVPKTSFKVVLQLG